MVKLEDIERLVVQTGFDLFGVTRAEYMPQGESHFRGWLARGCGDDLGYLHRNLELRFDPSRLIEGGRSVIVCAINYKSHYSLSSERAESGVGIGSYALMRDYHKTIRKRLKGVLKGLQELYPDLSGRVFTDSAPLLEKSLAVRAGLGWIGRNSLVVTPQFGSFVLLGEVLIDDEVDRYDSPEETRGCGECRRCLDSCPVGAINSDRSIDARRCIACRTIEVESEREESLSGWIFGCDVCQSVCPHNRQTPIASTEGMTPTITPPTAAKWLAMSDEEFVSMSQGTPLSRSSLERIQRAVRRNIAEKQQ